MSATLCLGGAEFWERLERDIRGARDYVYVQTLSFEGDAAGLGLAAALLACEAPRKRIVVDAVTKYLINDRFIGLPAARRDAGLQREVAATGEMCDRLERGGVPVRFAWPVGRRFHRLIARNHKKLIAIDDRIAYLGGINFSEHKLRLARLHDPHREPRGRRVPARGLRAHLAGTRPGGRRGDRGR